MPAHGPDADLHQLLGQSLFHDPGKGTGVRKAVPLEVVVQVVVGVEVEDGERRVMAPHRTEHRVGDRVVAPQHEGPPPRLQEPVHRALDGGARRLA